MSMVLRLKTQRKEFFLLDFRRGAFFAEHAFQNLAVFKQGVVDAADKIVGRASDVIVVGAPAVFVTEFFVGSAIDGLSTAQAAFFPGR